MDSIKEPTLYVFLDEKYKFPPWFEKWSNGTVTVPLSQRYSKGYRFKYDNEYVGQDDNYRFFLSDLSVNDVVKNGKFLMMIVIQPESKTDATNYIKQLFLTYETLCPIVQFPDSYYDL